jgi:hypothetical protein
MMGSPSPVSPLISDNMTGSKGGSIPQIKYGHKKTLYRVKKYFWEKICKTENIPYI